MCEAVTGIALSTWFAAGAAAGAAVTAYGAVQQGKAQEETAQNNAKTLQLQAADAQARGGIAEEAHRAKVRQIRGEQRATLAASGVDMTYGTAASVLDQTTIYGELDARNISVNAAREAWGYETQAGNELFQGKTAKQQGYLSGVSTLLTGAARAYGIYKGGKK